MLRGCSQSLFISERVRSDFHSLVRLGTEPLFLPNGVDTRVFCPGSPAERHQRRCELGLPPDRVIMLFVGRLIEKKGLPILRELAREFPECIWILIGQGSRTPSTWGLSNVLCLGPMDHTALVSYYQAADLLVHPSVVEGFPLVVQEAMACGTPAIITRVVAAAALGIERVACVSEPVSLAEAGTGRLALTAATSFFGS